jgi:sigma-B regulation protein RsbU (phosphoserine phosphatase)
MSKQKIKKIGHMKEKSKLAIAQQKRIEGLELEVKVLQEKYHLEHINLLTKQLQINRLLNVTQAINNNVRIDELFRMYKEFLNWDLGVQRIALFLPSLTENGLEKEWICFGSDGVLLESNPIVFTHELSVFDDVTHLRKGIHPFFDAFEQVIPVKHKDDPIAYSFISGIAQAADATSKIQLITTLTNVIAVAFENKRLFKRQLEQERLNHEMSLAGDMQQKLVPEKRLQTQHFEVSSIYKPHLGIGGDYFDCIQYFKNRYVFCVADVSGKGLAAALVMSNFQACLHILIRKSNTVEAFIHELNEAIVRITRTEKYITFFIAEYDCDTRRLRYINAGHIPPLLVRGNQFELLKKGCTILGYFKKLPHVEVGEVYLEEDAFLCMFTDGITDIKNESGVFFDDQILSDFTVANSYLSTAAFNQALMRQVEQFKGAEDYPDDITVLTCKFFPKK